MRGYNLYNYEAYEMNMEEKKETQGKTTIDPGVLVEIAKLATLSVPGVSDLAQGPQHTKSIFSKRISSGIKIDVENLNNNKAVLSFLSGENISVIDTITSKNESEFYFSLEFFYKVT